MLIRIANCTILGLKFGTYYSKYVSLYYIPGLKFGARYYKCLWRQFSAGRTGGKSLLPRVQLACYNILAFDHSLLPFIVGNLCSFLPFIIWLGLEFIMALISGGPC